MLEFLCAIPEEIGWVIVGAVGMITFQLLCVLVWQIALEPLVCSIKKWWAIRKEMREVAN
jgi:hypothetical protein